MRSMDLQERFGQQTVATLFADRGTEALVAQALEAQGLRVMRHPGMAGLIASLGDGVAELAVVQDAGSMLTGCLAGLRLRGLASARVIAIGAGSLTDIMQAYELGACDYALLGEPMNVFVNRVRARISLARRQAQCTTLSAGCCVLDGMRQSLRGPAGEFRLTEREFELARLLFEHAGETVNSRTLARHVWGRDVSLAKRTIEQHVCRLRHKLRGACAGHEAPALKAVNGVGYRLAIEANAAAPTGIAGVSAPIGTMRADWHPATLA